MSTAQGFRSSQPEFDADGPGWDGDMQEIHGNPTTVTREAG